MKRCSYLYSAAIYFRMHSYYMFASILPKISNIQGQQIKVVVNGDDIAYYADKLVLLSSYLISTAWVKDLPKSYARPIHTYYWILDKETIVECINPNDKIEKTLPPPTKLNLTPLATVAQLTPTPSAELVYYSCQILYD
ncbi:putative peptide/nitrate transporter-like [Capsicum annuum]|nr:putative peptide/nitrate transporter-like [Capsicum annuum]KAF3682577.1 putative peptide/nitrate transporter-like [Capsicum annuum]